MLLQVDMKGFVEHRAAVLTLARKIAYDYDLGAHWEYFCARNTAAGLSYHNRYHTAWMITKVFRMASDPCFNATIGINQLQSLILAAMFHDMNHSGGVEKDTANVTRAAECLREAVAVVPYLKNANMLDIITCAEKAIICTQYPFIVPPANDVECILRDADIMQGMTEHFVKIIYIDLFSELLVSNPGMTFEQYMRGQKQFLTDAEMFTPHGKDAKEKFIRLNARPFWDSYEKWLFGHAVQS